MRLRLLAADLGQLTARLMVMKLAAQSTDVDVVKIVESHPSLLLQKTFLLDQQASSSILRQPPFTGSPCGATGAIAVHAMLASLSVHHNVPNLCPGQPFF